MDNLPEQKMNKSNSFIHITDLHLHKDSPTCWNAIESFVGQVLKMKHPPDFIINTGDTVFANMQITTLPQAVEPDFKRYIEIISRLPVPVYHVLGNHDMTHSAETTETAAYGKELFEKYCGPRYQSFDWDDCHGIILDEWLIQKDYSQKNETRNLLTLVNDIDPVQFNWLKNDLAGLPANQKIFIFTHRRLMNNQKLWSRISKLLSPEHNYIEVSGCDHQNTFWADGNWSSYTTSSFCGSWWDGKSIDNNLPGYALIYYNESTPKHYYKPIDKPLAIASPKEAQIVGQEIALDAVDPETDFTERSILNLTDMTPGWNKINVKVRDKSQSVDVFKEPNQNDINKKCTEAIFEFELVGPAHGPLTIKFNGAIVAEINPQNKTKEPYVRLTIPVCVLNGWNNATLIGDAIIRSPQLVIDEKIIYENRIEKLESLRPAWFADILKIQWDISRKRFPTPARYPGNTFYFLKNAV